MTKGSTFTVMRSTVSPPIPDATNRFSPSGGTIEPIHNAVSLAEIAIEKGAKALLLPVACRKQLFDLSDDMATKLDIELYQDGRDALLKALTE
ncbi:hypothetical protein N9L30_03600 [Burkholderiaceae bacterium]|nr:hypothetical protein [Burkholderiaceae bacterium]